MKNSWNHEKYLKSRKICEITKNSWNHKKFAKLWKKNAFFATDWPILLSPAPRPKKEAVHHLCYRRNNPDDPDQLEKQNCCTFFWYWNWANLLIRYFGRFSSFWCWRPKSFYTILHPTHIDKRLKTSFARGAFAAGTLSAARTCTRGRWRRRQTGEAGSEPSRSPSWRSRWS